MSYRNTINLTDAELDTPVYRIMSLSRLKQVLRAKQLTLVKPRMWDDPFENALLNATFSTPDGERFTYAARDSVYGQCWTLHRETDAMWRIYSHAKDGVRVTSTPRKLLAALNGTDPKFHRVHAFIGKVSYIWQKNLLAKLGELNLTASDGSGVAESLLYKRKEFSHEAEVRLIFCGPDGECAESFYQIPIDPNVIFAKLLFDPRASMPDYRAARKELKALGFNQKIEKSGLYKPPVGLLFKA